MYFGYTGGERDIQLRDSHGILPCEVQDMVNHEISNTLRFKQVCSAKTRTLHERTY